MFLVVIAPCHNETESLPYFERELTNIESKLESYLDRPVEYVLVDDGSTDSTLDGMRELHVRNERWHYVSFTRNFGKEAALLAGMKKALALGASHIAVMDADLQDPPELLVEMCEKITTSDCDAVAAYRRTRDGEPPLRSWFAHRFYEFMEKISEVSMRDGARDYRVMTRRMVEEVCNLSEVGRFSKGLFMWVGHTTEWIGYDNIEREHGTTSWSFFGLVRYALDGIVNFSTWPLEMISVLGMCTSLVALLFLLFIFVRALLFGDRVAGWPSMMCVIMLLGGIQIMSLGVIGLYISKIFSEVKARPVYLVAEEN